MRKPRKQKESGETVKHLARRWRISVGRVYALIREGGRVKTRTSNDGKRTLVLNAGAHPPERLPWGSKTAATPLDGPPRHYHRVD